MSLRIVSGQDEGLRRIRRGRGFEYRTADGVRITDETDLARIRALAIPPAWRDVWICGYPNGHLQATGVDGAGRTQYLYHPEWAERAAQVKFDRALDLAQALPRARASVTRDLRLGTPTRPTVLAAAFRMLDAALLRIGSEAYAQEHGSIGLTTLRGSHATIAAPVVSLRFTGKSSIAWETDIDDADLAAVLTVLRRRGARRKLLSWRDENRWRPLRPAEINDDVRARTGGEFTAKDFRTIHGTVIAATSLARSGVAETESARNKAIRDAVVAAATALGNTPAVARSSYIDPRLFEQYERGHIVRRDGPSVERQLLDLLP
ncbi:DNA topoisomerase IB [uncultured Microbacterium sp.]|uniref:DNA topoisomerase IB n=1 Tax=uncultured Microbacterium sp. TaxID=191216 RepID=UPI0025FB589A|nr:DNA topoisomerase IB [uncultured Microbacterium sp.]